MKLYYSRGTCSLSVRITINELGLDCEYISVDIKNKKTDNGEDYYKINSKGAVPCLITNDGITITENLAIQSYLANFANNTDIAPNRDNPNYYKFLEWFSYVTSDLHKSCLPVFMPLVPNQLKDELFRPFLGQKLKYVNSCLKDKKFLVGDNFTLVDGYLFTVVSWMPFLRIDISRWEHLTNYFKKLSTRPSIVKSLQEEGLTPKVAAK